MTLSVVIPVHNDLANLKRLLWTLASLDICEHIIVCDDGSDPAITETDLHPSLGASSPKLTLLRNETAKGAGAARNIGFPHVTSRFTLFLDSDDLPTPQLRWLISDLADHTFDFCLFQHHDSRQDDHGVFGQMEYDQRFWDKAGLGAHALHALDRSLAPLLVQTSNFPWNKIYESRFLRQNDLRCSETMVHNDIGLHWNSFLCGQNILVSDRKAVVHFVSSQGARLTNRRGAERLEVFAVLEELAEKVAQVDCADYQIPFWRFSLTLLKWIEENIASDLLPRLHARTERFCASHLPADLRIALDAEQRL